MKKRGTQMKQRLAFLMIFAVLCSTIYSAQARQAGQKKDQVASGEKLYMSYCASCHGVDGAGAGAVAPALKKQPPDLRRIQTKRNKFPTEEVRKKIAGDLSSPVHGRKDMPVWGLILSPSDINHLVKYLESIQRPFDAQTTE
jgi:mono/diheme cytochrome c family protein